MKSNYSGRSGPNVIGNSHEQDDESRDISDVNDLS